MTSKQSTFLARGWGIKGSLIYWNQWAFWSIGRSSWGRKLSWKIFKGTQKRTSRKWESPKVLEGACSVILLGSLWLRQVHYWIEGKSSANLQHFEALSQGDLASALNGGAASNAIHRGLGRASTNGNSRSMTELPVPGGRTTLVSKRPLAMPVRKFIFCN